MINYFQTIADELGISVYLLAVILIWSLAWKFSALWKSARKKHVVWFVILAILNTLGLLEILYIFVFSKLHHHTGPIKQKKTPAKRKPTRKRTVKKSRTRRKRR